VPPWQVAFGEQRRGTLADSPFMPDWDPSSRRVMFISDAGEPGIVLAGRAEISDVGMPVQPAGTPWLAKISRADGTALWTWHLDDYALGYFTEAAADAAGDVVAAGTQRFPDNSSGPLVISVDGATGATRWRVDGPAQFSALGVALDPDGNALVTAAQDHVRQDVSKYARDTGALLWSSAMPDYAVWDDALVRVDGNGDVVAAGAYELFASRTVVEDGLQIAKFRGTDGQLLWSRRFVNAFMATVHALRVLPDGDVVLAGDFANGVDLVRLEATTGATAWQRGDVGASDVLIDHEGQIVVSGTVNAPGTTIPVGDVQRLDATNGSTLWRRQFSPDAYTVAWRMEIGSDGQLLVGLSDGDGAIPFEAAGLDLATGGLRWWFASGDRGYEETFPVGIVQDADGALYFGGFNYVPTDADPTWTTFKLAPIAADTIFASGLD
jgi:hypothetical protein